MIDPSINLHQLVLKPVGLSRLAQTLSYWMGGGGSGVKTTEIRIHLPRCFPSNFNQLLPERCDTDYFGFFLIPFVFSLATKGRQVNKQVLVPNYFKGIDQREKMWIENGSIRKVSL
jgi:hypothetical protein